MLVADREFLPAALEILETPPSPIRSALILVVACLAIVSVVWAALGEVDIVAVAQGKIQPTGRVKSVQALETGKIVRIAVAGGDRVEAGAVLFALDPTEAAAEETAAAAALAASRAEILRRRAFVEAVAGASGAISISPPPVEWPATLPTAIAARERRVLAADLAQVSSTLAGLDGQREQKRAERDRLDATIAVQRELVEALAARVEMRATLLDKASGSRASLIDAQESLLGEKVTLASEVGQLVETAAALAQIDREMRRIRETTIAENTQKLAEAEARVDELEQRHAKARSRLDHMVLTSPISGTALVPSVTTLGQVVTTGEEVQRIVPENSTIEVEAYLLNRDAGFVREGDVAAIKIESFPFTRYGSVPGRVVRVARDAVPEPDAQALEGGGPAPTDRSRSTAGRAQRVQNLVFPVTVALERTTIDVDGRQVTLSAGMAVTAEIRTGARSILEYLFSPLAEVASQAMKER